MFVATLRVDPEEPARGPEKPTDPKNPQKSVAALAR
jgi:hypothetical protein